MKVGNRKKIAFTVFNPGFPLCVLALGAMAVTAGIVANADMPAMIAPVNMAAQGCAPATLQGAQRPSNIGIGRILLFKIFYVTFNDLGQFKRRSQSREYNLSNGLNRLVRLGLATCR